jgi:hypothetical protein
MPAHTGEKARETGTFHCAKCDGKVHVEKGETIPECPCGENTFDRRTNEPDNG